MEEERPGTSSLPGSARVAPGQLEPVLAAQHDEVVAYIARHLPEELRRHIDPNDVLQDVWLEAVARFGKFQPAGPDSLRRWLLTIARNRMTDLLRRHRALKRGGGRRNEMDHIGHDSVVLLLGEVAVHEKTPSLSAIRHELAALVEQALEALPAEYRQALRLRYLEGLSPAAIARQMARSDRAVQMLCYRGLSALREQLLCRLHPAG